QLLVDPGLGFAKTGAQSLELLAHVGELRSLGYPVVVGASRKSFLGALAAGAPVGARLEASLAAAVLAASQGTQIVRVHDVAATVQALAVVDAVRRAGLPLSPQESEGWDGGRE
ncbi:MAG TPA: dihydropteroate synthase, partial [Thermoplasmata archaeon]